MQPYYQDELVTLYHGNCLEIDAWLESDVMVTDPPYGVKLEQRGTYNKNDPSKGKHGHAGRTNVIASDKDTAVRDTSLTMWGNKPAIVFGTWKMPRPKCNSVLVWNKMGCYPGPLNAAFYTAHEEIYVIGKGFRRSSPPQRSVLTTTEARQSAVRIGHPTPKPIDLMETLVDRCLEDWVIADPFAGSGATLIAAKNLGRKSIGVELEERYCELIAKRLDQGTLNLLQRVTRDVS